MSANNSDTSTLIGRRPVREALERENARLQQKLSTAEDCLSLQKKALSMLDRMNNGNEP